MTDLAYSSGGAEWLYHIENIASGQRLPNMNERYMTPGPGSSTPNAMFPVGTRVNWVLDTGARFPGVVSSLTLDFSDANNNYMYTILMDFDGTPRTVKGNDLELAGATAPTPPAPKPVPGALFAVGDRVQTLRFAEVGTVLAVFNTSAGISYRVEFDPGFGGHTASLEGRDLAAYP